MSSGFIFRCLCLLAANGMAFAQQPTFAPGLNYPVGSYPETVVISDLNNDGVPDLAVTNAGSNSVSIYLGRGDGTFRASAPAVVNAPTFMAVADLNGDGKLDLVVSSSYQNYVSVLFGNGDGTFQAPVVILAGVNSFGVAVGDLNGDGKPDIAVGHFLLRGGFVSVLLNNGDGTFQPPVRLEAGYDSSLVKVADVNGDGKADLLVVDQGHSRPGENGSVAVLLGHGDGTFDAAKFYAAGEQPRGFALGDFNGDGKLDIAVTNVPFGHVGSVAVLLGNGDGSFQAPAFFDAGSFPFRLAVADFNGDGKQDLVVVSAYVYGVLLGNGDGSFQPPLFLPGGSPVDVAAGDLNGDGKPDVVGTDFVGFTVTVFLNTTP